MRAPRSRDLSALLRVCLLAWLCACSPTSDRPRDANSPQDAGAAHDTTLNPDMRATETGGDADTNRLPDIADAMEDTPEVSDTDVREPDSDGSPDPRPDYADAEVCDEVDAFGPVFDTEVQRWAAQDDAGSPRVGGLVLVGGSSARRWEGFARAYTDYDPVQRGFGGAQLGEVALRAQSLVLRHAPRAVLVFAGANDVAAGVPPETVVERFKCLRQRIGRGLGWHVPVVFIGITPTPARWAGWDNARAVNDAVANLREDDPALFYADVPSAFLETGSPPTAELFVGDRLHLSPAGYRLWEATIRPVVEAAAAPFPAVASAPQPGQRILVDLGPNNDGDGEDTVTPDYLGQTWNNWHTLAGDGDAWPGEHLDGLLDDEGRPTEVDLVITGGFKSNGWAHGGHRWPDTEDLGPLAVGSATGDFFYTEPTGTTGGLYLRGLSPDTEYRIRLFASRDTSETRVTRYTAHGASTQMATLQTSGAGAGPDGETGNRGHVAELTLRPDPWGHIFLDISIDQGPYGYISLLEIGAL